MSENRTHSITSQRRIKVLGKGGDVSVTHEFKTPCIVDYAEVQNAGYDAASVARINPYGALPFAELTVSGDGYKTFTGPTRLQAGDALVFTASGWADDADRVFFGLDVRPIGGGEG